MPTSSRGRMWASAPINSIELLAKREYEGGNVMEKEKRDEKQPIPWEATDPKPPVIHSGHLENRQY